MSRKKSFRRWLIEATQIPEERERRRVEPYEKRRDADLKRLGWDSYEEFQSGAEERWRRLGFLPEEG